MLVGGGPTGVELAGTLAEQSLATAIVPAIAFCVLGTVFAATMVPRRDPAEAFAPAGAAARATEP